MSETESSSHRSNGVHLRDIPTDLVWKVSGVLAIALVLGILFIDIVQMAIRPMGILIASIIVALTLAPIVNKLEQWMPRFLAVLLVYFSLVMVIVGFAMVLLPPVVGQAVSLVTNFPEHYRDAQVWSARTLGINMQRDMDQFSGFVEPATQALFALPATIMSTSVEIFVGFFVSLYWLHSMPRLKAFFLSLFPPHHQERTDDILHMVGQRMGGYMRGVVIVGALVGLAVYIGLSILGVKYALLLALVAFLGEFFPNVGPVLAGIPAVTIAFFQSPTLAIIVLVYYIIVQQVESYILMPVIMMHGDVDIPPLMTTFAVFTGFMIGGVLWAILAIPIAGALMCLITEVIAPSVRRRTGADTVELDPVAEGPCADVGETVQRRVDDPVEAISPGS